MLSPPSRMCSPTASRERTRSPPSSADGDQGEVGRAAADVADQDDVTDLDLLSPLVALHGEPGVEGRLGFLEQGYLLEPGLGRGLHGQLASHGVERGGDGQEHFLVFEPVVGLLARDPEIPGLAQVLKIELTRRSTGETLATPSAAVQGKMLLRRSTPGVGKPALGRADQPAWHLGSVLAREGSDARDRAATSRAGRARPRETPWTRAGKERRAEAIARRRRLRPRPGGSAVSRSGWGLPRPLRPSRRLAAYARAVLVVPRSMPTT